MYNNRVFNWRARYLEAYLADYKERYPECWAQRENIGYPEPKYPVVAKANGLTKMICDFLNWSGHRATRVSSAGRMIDSTEKQQSGVMLKTKKYIPGPTRKGSADISATIKGRSVMIEIKIGSDRPSPFQLAEQAKERKAGGIYQFIHNTLEFFVLYDDLIAGKTPGQIF